MAEKVLIAVEFDMLVAQKRIEELTQQLVAAKAAQAALNAEFKQGKITAEAHAKAYTESQKAIREMNAEQAGLITNTRLAEKVNKSAVGSLNEMSARYSLLVQAIRNLSEEERENSELGKSLVAQAKELNDQLKEQEKAYGSTGRNVGNYRQDITDALKEVGLFGNVLDNVKGIQEGFAKAQTAVKSSVVAAKNAVKDTKEALKEAKQSLNDAKGATENLAAAQQIMKASFLSGAGALNVFKLALAATGIGALVLVFGSLVTFLTSSQKGIDFVSQKLKGLSTVVGFVTKTLSDFGETLFESLSSPKKALETLVGFIESQVVNRLKAVKLLVDALFETDLRKFNAGLVQATTGIVDLEGKTKAYVKELNKVLIAGEAIEKENQRIRDEERKTNLERAKSKSAIEELKFISEDVTKSTKERIKAAKEAFELENKSADAQFKTQEAKIANLKKEQSLSNKLNEDNNQLAEEQMKLAELQESSATRRIELNNKINSLLAEQAAKAKAARDAEAKAQADYLARTKTEYDQQVKFTADFYAQQETQLLQSLAKGELTQSAYEEAVTTLKFDALKRQLQDAKDYGQLSAELERKLAEESVKIAKDALDKKFNDIVAGIAREKKEKNIAFEDTIKDITQNEAERNLVILQARLDGQISEYEFQKQTLESQLTFLNSQLQAAKDHGDKTVEIEKAIAETKQGIRNNDLQNAQHIEDAKFQLATTGLAAIGGLLQLGAKNASQAAEFAKAIALFQIGIDTAKAISGIVAAAGSTSITPIDLAIRIAAGVATVIANIAQAKALLEGPEPPKPQFYDGGEFSPDGAGYTTRGNPHEEAINLGDKPYVYHKNEYVMSNAVLNTPQGSALARAAEAVRKQVRGNPGISGRFNGGIADGGLTARSITGQGFDPNVISDAVTRGLSKVKIYTSVTDINTVNKSVNTNQAKATL